MAPFLGFRCRPALAQRHIFVAIYFGMKKRNPHLHNPYKARSGPGVSGVSKKKTDDKSNASLHFFPICLLTAGRCLLTPETLDMNKWHKTGE